MFIAQELTTESSFPSVTLEIFSCASNPIMALELSQLRTLLVLLRCRQWRPKRELAFQTHLLPSLKLNKFGFVLLFYTCIARCSNSSRALFPLFFALYLKFVN
jgi:hypothetical protein